ncbi:hypothetical protein ACWT_3152 [Actinoplanes sp. SE50]|uniref:hypothetical protein n=1 Tax=unclassified Actinoplanes TaxID=2626549 RepID=UPI00023EC5FE|nr:MULTISPECIES: hypothetical protein [unclassified Actinoplanes]AEV84175.1 hypothetical protein ACPL_3280 [Actinoplanes sp. SE50/110]ATO82567.1 hypothetical protein ACWT_3152 [Actinoplanes sp. SE50]SLL99974.1 hypothetical protein ACSP50_3206 [Actinoplanes sp. SE50/110]
MRRAPIVAALGAAAGSETLSVLSTQIRDVRASSPWQSDPYNTVLSVTVFAVPVLAVLIAGRLAAWQAAGGGRRGREHHRAPGDDDRERQLRRAAAALLGLAGATAVIEWIAVALRPHPWRGWTGPLIGGLTVATLALALATGLLLRRRLPRRAPGIWASDWLSDLAGPPIPRPLTGWIRRHATAVFAGLSVLAAAGVVGSLAVGEAWTDPLLIGWAFVLEASAWFALAVLGNRICVFVLRPPHRTDAAAIGFSLGMLVATAFHGPISTVPALVAVTAGAGLVGAVLASVHRPRIARVPG